MRYKLHKRHKDLLDSTYGGKRMYDLISNFQEDSQNKNTEILLRKVTAFDTTGKTSHYYKLYATTVIHDYEWLIEQENAFNAGVTIEGFCASFWEQRSPKL